MKSHPRQADIFLGSLFVRRVGELTSISLPLWSLPTSWLALWLLYKAHGWLRVDEAAPDAAELLERQRETTTVYRELSESRKEWGESLRAEREEIRSKMSEEFERMAAGFIAIGTELDSVNQESVLEQRRTRLAGLLLKDLGKHAEQLARDIRNNLKNDIDNITGAYLQVRDDWPVFAEHFVAGSTGGQVPEPRYYVQRMIYYIGAMTRHFELTEFKIRTMGIIHGVRPSFKFVHGVRPSFIHGVRPSFKFK